MFALVAQLSMCIANQAQPLFSSTGACYLLPFREVKLDLASLARGVHRIVVSTWVDWDVQIQMWWTRHKCGKAAGQVDWTTRIFRLRQCVQRAGDVANAGPQE